MSGSRRGDPRSDHGAVPPSVAWPGRDEEALRQRWDAAGAALRERFDEPIQRATELTRRTLAWFPVRVWRHFLRSNGFLMAASISYQALFAIYAVIYVAFAVVGTLLGAGAPAVARLIAIVNGYIPGLISKEGLIDPDAVAEVAKGGGGVLAVTGAVAVVVAAWTAIGFVTFTRRAVRGIFGLPFDTRNYFLLKAKDLLAAAMFGFGLLLGAAVSFLATGLLDFLLSLIGLAHRSAGFPLLVRLLSLVVAFALNSCALAGLFRFLTGTSLPWSRIWPGSLLAGAAMAVLQVAVGYLFVYTPSNPLLATFSIMVAFLLWFRLVGIVILVGASWIGVSAGDRDIPLSTRREAEQLLSEHEALLLAAHVRVREARRERAGAPWYLRARHNRAVQDAEDELARVESTAPPQMAGPVAGPRGRAGRG